MPHSPGPWHIDDLGVSYFSDTNHRYGIGADAHPTHRVAKIEGMGETAEANANLIAAAPEMADALGAACRIIESARKMLWEDATPARWQVDSARWLDRCQTILERLKSIEDVTIGRNDIFGKPK